MSTPTNRKTLAFSYLRQALADSPTFQSWVGATGDPELAKESIYADAVPRTGPENYSDPTWWQSIRPYALIRDESYSSEPDAGQPDATESIAFEGQLSITFEADANTEAANYDIHLDFHNVIGGIIDDLWDNCLKNDGHLIPRRIDVTEGHYRADDEEIAEEGDFISIPITVSWGPGQ